MRTHSGRGPRSCHGALSLQLFYAASVGLCVAALTAFRLPAFTARENLAATALLLLLFGCVRLRACFLRRAWLSSLPALRLLLPWGELWERVGRGVRSRETVPGWETAGQPLPLPAHGGSKLAPTGRYAVLPGMHLASRLFPSADVAFIAHVSLSFVLGLCTLLTATVPRLLAVATRAQVSQPLPSPPWPRPCPRRVRAPVWTFRPHTVSP